MENTDVTTKGRRKVVGKIAAGGGVLMVGVLLATNFAGLAGWQKTLSGEDTTIQAGTLMGAVTPGYKVYDITSGIPEQYEEIDPETFMMSPGDALRIVQGLDITVQGDNLAAELTGAVKAVEGVLPVHSSLALLKGDANPIAQVLSDRIGFSEDGSLAKVPMNFNGTRHYQVASDVVFPANSEMDMVNVESVVGASTWTLKQVEADRVSAWNIADPVLDKAVRKQLSLPDDQRLTTADAAKFTRMPTMSGAELAQLKDLSGAEKMVNMTSVNLKNSGVTSVKPLAALPKMSSLSLDGSAIVDLSGIGSAPQLISLTLGGTSVADLGPLAGNTSLTVVDITGNTAITSIAPVASMTELRNLFMLGATGVTDFTPLAGMTKAEGLILSGTSISDLTPLTNLDRLRDVNVSNVIGVTDVAPLSNKPSLANLNITGTNITDMSTLVGVPELKTIYAFETPVTNWGGLDVKPGVKIFK